MIVSHQGMPVVWCTHVIKSDRRATGRKGSLSVAATAASVAAVVVVVVIGVTSVGNEVVRSVGMGVVSRAVPMRVSSVCEYTAGVEDVGVGVEEMERKYTEVVGRMGREVTLVIVLVEHENKRGLGA